MNKNVTIYSSDSNNNKFNIGTWSIRTMKDGKLDEYQSKWKKAKLDIVGICETDRQEIEILLMKN